jgi:hypothetical protein
MRGPAFAAAAAAARGARALVRMVRKGTESVVKAHIERCIKTPNP